MKAPDRYVAKSLARSVSFGRIRLRSETFGRARPLDCSVAGQRVSLEDHTMKLHTRVAGYLSTVLFFIKIAYQCVFL